MLIVKGGHALTRPETNAELRADVEPIDVLLAERDDVVRKLAPLWAKYGPGGTAESALSAKRSEIAEMLRAMAAADERKVTEARLDDASRGHKLYLDFLARQTVERCDYFLYDQQLRAIDARLNRGQALLRAYAAEVRT